MNLSKYLKYDNEYYENLKGLERSQIAWEFLRRNPDYKNDYHSLFLELPVLRQKLNEESFSADLIAQVSCYDRDRCNFIYENILENAEAICIKYALTNGIFPPDPDSPHTLAPIFQTEWGPTYTEFNPEINEQSGLMAEDEGDIIIRLNAFYPVKKQLAAIKSILTRKHRAVKSYDTKIYWQKLPLYIQLLDAKEGGASDSEIAKLLFPYMENTIENDHMASHKVRDAFKAAIHFRDFGYRMLFFYKKQG
jgi:hypothetical protein